MRKYSVCTLTVLNPGFGGPWSILLKHTKLITLEQDECLLFRTYLSTISSFLKVQWPFKITANTLTFAILKQMEYIYTRNTFFYYSNTFFSETERKKKAQAEQCFFKQKKGIVFQIGKNFFQHRYSLGTYACKNLLLLENKSATNNISGQVCSRQLHWKQTLASGFRGMLFQEYSPKLQ